MPDSVPTNVTAERFDRYAKRGIATEARKKKWDLTQALDSTVRALRDLHDAGVPSADVLDAAKGLHDAITNADHRLNVDIDDAGEWFDAIDLSELDAVIERLS